MTRIKNPAEPAAPKTTYKKGRKPHNATPAADYLSLEDLVQKVGSGPRKVLIDGELVEMSRCERTFRLVIGRALEGNAREVAQILRHMLKYPELSKSFKEEFVIIFNGVDCLA
jgi:hypothetical protein